MNRKAYSTDLSDAEWQVLEPLLPKRFRYGRPPKWTLREIIDGMLYILRTGSQWHNLPHDFPPYKTVFDYYRRWRRSGVWEQVHTTLRERLRIALGKGAQPSAAIIDSQSVKTTEKGGHAVTTAPNG